MLGFGASGPALLTNYLKKSLTSLGDGDNFWNQVETRLKDRVDLRSSEAGNPADSKMRSPRADNLAVDISGADDPKLTNQKLILQVVTNSTR